MIKRINKTEEIKARLSKEAKVTYLDKPEHLDAILKMNVELEKVRRDYKMKEKNSQTSASKVVLTS